MSRMSITCLAVLGCATTAPSPSSMTHATPATTPPSIADATLGISAPMPPIVAVPAPALRTQTRPLPADIGQLRGLRGFAMSPDGSRVAYVVRTPSFDPTAKSSPDDTRGGWKVDQQLFVVERTGGVARQMTFGDEPVAAPRWAPDGQRLAFLRKNAIQLIALAGGESRTLATGDLEVEDYAWAPDGKSVAILAKQPRSPEEKAADWKRGGARAIGEWRQTHLYVVALAGGEPRHVNRGTENILDFAWSPDGKQVAVVRTKTSDPLDENEAELAVISAADGEPRVLDHGDKVPFVITKIAWSPDAKKVAYSLTARGGMSHIDELRVVDAATGKMTDVAAKLDLEISGFAWAGDSRSLIANALVHTASKLYRLPLDGAAKEIAIGVHAFRSMQADRSGRYIVAPDSSGSTTADLAVFDVERGSSTVVTKLNPQLAEWSVAKTEIVRWKNAEGVELEGVLTIAGDGKNQPLVVIPHGGPDWVTLDSFDDWAQFLAARGYSTFAPNYRGGLGYGRAFYEANRGRFGEIEQMDIDSGVDALIASGKVDRTKLFFAGWSWGGYISAWMLGHSDRYRAHMIGAGVVDVVVQYATSDINHGTSADWEFRGRPWSQREAFDRTDPSRGLVHAKAPTLILHGEQDRRVPYVNGQILYRALVDRGVPVTFWSYPREDHGFSEIAHDVHMLEVWAAFFDAQLAC